MSEANLQWIVNAYALIFGGFLLLGGRAGDLVGRKRIFLIGVVVFTVASLLAGLAPSSDVADRLPRAAGARRRARLARGAVDHHDDVRRGQGAREGARRVGGDRGRRRGRRSAPRRHPHRGASRGRGSSSSTSPSASRFVLSLRLVPESKDEHAHKSFDIAGAVTVTGGSDRARLRDRQGAETNGLGSAQTLGFFALAAVLLVAFVLIEQRSAEPLVRLSIFGVRTSAARTSRCSSSRPGMFAMFFFNTLYIQRVLGYSAARGGLAFLPFTAGIIIGAGLSQRSSPKVGARELPLIGMAMAVVGLLLFVRLQPTALRHRHPAGDHAHVDRDGVHLRAGDADRDERHPDPTPGSRPGSTTRRSRSAARSASRSSRRSPRARSTTRSPRSAGSRREATRRRRSSTGSTSRTSEARCSSPSPRCSCCCCCVGRTSP